MVNKPSKRHHYLPRKYLKGFVDGQNGFWIYDKQKDVFFKSSPDDTFFEKGLNTIDYPNGETSDFLEGLYSNIEGDFWRFFDIISKSTSKTSIQFSEKEQLFLFLLILYWRLPVNAEYLNNYSERAFSKDDDIDFFCLKSKKGGDVPEEIKNIIKNSNGFKKSARLIAPFAPFYKKDWILDLNNWRFLYPSDDNSWYIVGDNPIITEGFHDHDPLNCLNEFVFPVSGRILLVNMKNSVLNDLPREFFVKFSMAIMERSKRFIAGKNEQLLRKLVDHYKVFVKFGKKHLIIPTFFNDLRACNNL